MEKNKTVSTIARPTEKEIWLVELLADGMRHKEIGEAMGISSRTVELYSDKLKAKLGAKTLMEVVAIFFRNKLIN